MAEKNGTPKSKPDVEQLRAEIAQTRAELGETVQALAAKADVKARAKAEVEQTKQRVRAQAAEASGKFRDAAQAAGDRVRQMTSSFGSGSPFGSSDHGSDGGPGPAHLAGDRVRQSPIPLTAVLIAAAGLAGLILILRGRRR